MINVFRSFKVVLVFLVLVSCNLRESDTGEVQEENPSVTNNLEITVNVGEILNDISSKPFGINLNTLTDDQANRAAGAEPLAEALKKIGVHYLRYPGGEKSDVYKWASDPFDSPTTSSLSRISSLDFPAGDTQFWNLSQNEWANDNYNFDEFMVDCKAVGGEPVIVVALDGIYKPAFTGGTSLTKEVALEMATQWVKYANITKGYNVKYWSLGNETWNNDSYGGSNPGFTQYGKDVALFAKAMKEIDPTIKIGINGDNAQTFIDALKESAAFVDFLDIHTYPCFGFTNYSDYESKDLIINKIIEDAVAAKTTLTPSDSDRIFIAMTEISAYGYQDNGNWDTGANLGQSLANFEMLATLATDSRIEFTQFWNTRWIKNNTSITQPTDVFTSKNELNANGKVLALLHHNVFDKMVKTNSSGKVKTFASYNEKSKELVVFLLNKAERTIVTDVLLKDYTASSIVEQSIYSGLNTQDVNPSVKNLPNLNFTNNKVTLDLAPASITVIKFQKK